MPVTPARRIAFDVLRRVESEGAYASDVLHAELGGGSNLKSSNFKFSNFKSANFKSEDAALATELALGVLRQRRLLDFLLARQLKKPVEKLDLPVLLALRMGLYQIRFLERIPARAAVNESVELVKLAKKFSAATLVNAVLRRAADEAHNPVEEFLPANLPLVDRLGTLYSHPNWLVERWLARLGGPQTLALLEANNRTPRLACALHTQSVAASTSEGRSFSSSANRPFSSSGSQESSLGGRSFSSDIHGPETSGALAPEDNLLQVPLFDLLEKSGLRIEPGVLLKNAFALSGGSPTRTDAFRKGLFSIQDEASQIIPLLLDVQPGDSVLDLCAAPGGKTAPLVRAAGSTGLVVAADRHAHRLRAMRDQFKRLALACVPLIELDAAHPLPFRQEFKRILVDAPCSGTGTLARHPEIRWRLRPEQLAEFHDLQLALLKNALAQLAPGGRLVYSTCSMEPEENEDVVADALREAPLIRRVSVDKAIHALNPHLASGAKAEKLFDAAGYFHSSPADYPTDGFFAAILEKQ
jgi:16S rRNA (cytosine967-C5)-methyltransferase